MVSFLVISVFKERMPLWSRGTFGDAAATAM